MSTDEKTIEQIADFIQSRALGSQIRQWLALESSAQQSAIQQYRQQASYSEELLMADSLLRIAAGYPNFEVRRSLVQLYGRYISQHAKQEVVQ